MKDTSENEGSLCAPLGPKISRGRKMVYSCKNCKRGDACWQNGKGSGLFKGKTMKTSYISTMFKSIWKKSSCMKKIVIQNSTKFILIVLYFNFISESRQLSLKLTARLL